ncbi:MAG TPA: S53 family peptidase [Steroidobacteraceae bacterium]|nr:S53 family peptidase [Steroidobacteraceae bacterium]
MASASRNGTTILPGSTRRAPAGARVLGRASGTHPIEITLRLRAHPGSARLEDFVRAQARRPPARRAHLTRAQFAARFGAAARDIARVEAFAHGRGLTVVRADPAARTVRLAGPVAAFESAFGVRLLDVRLGKIRFRGRTGAVRLPRELGGVVVGVHGLDSHPVARPHFRLRKPRRGARVRPGGKGRAADGTWTAPEVARLYNFPAKLTGAGQCIALIELNDLDSSGKPSGAGYSASDLDAYFKGLGLATPQVTAVSVDGGANLPGHSESDGEVVLDIEVAGAVAPGASIAVYFAPNTTDGFIDAVKTAAHDAVRRPAVISISWGGPEDPDGQEDSQFLDGLNEAIQEAAAMGVTVCVAAGDAGSEDMTEGWDGKPHADFPASSPYSLACGGTRLAASGGRITSETVWNDGSSGGAGGGGVSNVYPLPAWQQGLGVPKSPAGSTGRGVPDVAGNADPETGYQIVLDGRSTVIGGTSAVAPLMAALVALLNQSLGSKTAGLINPQIYAAGARSAFRDIVSGDNDMTGKLDGLYTAAAGWDACSGLGVPDGTALLTALGGRAGAAVTGKRSRARSRAPRR